MYLQFQIKIYSIKLMVVLLISTSIFSVNCASKKAVQPKPNWVLNKPNNSDYYTGIGVTAKTGDINQYKQTAKNNALKDLVSEISVNISNSSFLYKLSVNDNMKETYDSKTFVTTNEYIEGYELLSSFGDENNYWVYYQLSKKKFQELKKSRIQKALSNALAKYDNAINLKAKFQYLNALILLIKAVEDIKPYLSELLVSNYKNKEIYFGNELFNEIFYCVNEIKITSNTKEISVKKGLAINDDLLTFIVSDSKGNKIENIPVIASFSSGIILNEKSKSLINGQVQYIVPKVKTKKNNDFFIVKIDMNEIIQEATNDFFVKKVLKNFVANSYAKKVNINNPSFFITTTEKCYDIDNNVNLLKNAANYALINAGIESLVNNKNTDFIIEIKSNSQQLGNTNGYNNVVLNATIFVKNATKKVVYQRSINGIKSTQNSSESANNEVYNLGIEYIKIRIIPDILEQLL